MQIIPKGSILFIIGLGIVGSAAYVIHNNILNGPGGNLLLWVLIAIIGSILFITGFARLTLNQAFPVTILAIMGLVSICVGGIISFYLIRPSISAYAHGSRMTAMEFFPLGAKLILGSLSILLGGYFLLKGSRSIKPIPPDPSAEKCPVCNGKKVVKMKITRDVPYYESCSFCSGQGSFTSTHRVFIPPKPYLRYGGEAVTPAEEMRIPKTLRQDDERAYQESLKGGTVQSKTTTTTCSLCNGTGQRITGYHKETSIEEKKCKECQGYGTIGEHVQRNAKIPAIKKSRRVGIIISTTYFLIWGFFFIFSW